MSPHVMVGKQITDRKFNRSTCAQRVQGDVWGTQSDIFLTACGVVTSQLLLARWHERQLAALQRR